MIQKMFFSKSSATRTAATLLACLAIASCGDSSTEPPGEASSFELELVDNSGLPAPLWNKFGGQVLMNSATLQPHGPGKMRDVRVLRESYPGGFTLSRDSSIVEVQVSGARYIIRRPHPNPSLVRVDTGTVDNGLLIVPTTLDYQVQMGVPTKRVELKYTFVR